MNATEATQERIRAALEPLGGSAPAFAEARDGMPTLETTPANLGDVLAHLKDAAAFETLTLVTAVDHGVECPDEARFEVVHQLYSITHSDRVRLCTVAATRPDGASGDGEPSVPTCTHLWPGASFMERECFDLFGVRFDGHPDLRRLLMPEGYDHYPLRKDFPHGGIEPDRLYREWDRERREEAARGR